MPLIHRDGDLRLCGAITIATGQTSVYLNGKLIAVEGDQCSHGGGALISTSGSTLYIEGKRAIVVGDYAERDALCGEDRPPQHCRPIPITGSGDVF